ncbi:hypothetical protein [Jannaschia sp. LMIT008]|uniref:hypothetical protein n=1 Tax=Jannaschia maritima TaxID=3032585 RepID=UPI002810CB45|nr:hypothetical protein [Jannaschia sp. LMIT008]
MDLCWEVGPGFFLWPGFREIAIDLNLTGKQKVAAFEEVEEERAVDAIVGRDSSLWFDAPIPTADDWAVPDG